MISVAIHLLHVLTALARLLGPGGTRGVIAENLILKHQLCIHARNRKRAPNLTGFDRVLLGVWSLFLNPRRMVKAAIIVRPATLLKFHALCVQENYRRLYSSGNSGRPGPKGPSKEIINAVVAIKRRNPQFGCPRISQQINLTFGLDLDKDVVRRILANHYRPDRNDNGPSWLATLGHAKDSLWSVDLFRCESIVLNSYWVLVVMDQFSRRIIGFGVHKGDVDGPGLCRLFNGVIAKHDLPVYLSSDNDPLFRYHQWQANLRILDIKEVKSVPHVPVSHPFVERLIGSIRREYLDNVLFWHSKDLARKLLAYQQYFNTARTHSSLDGTTPIAIVNPKVVDINDYRWQTHCRGLFALPVAA